MIRANSPYYVSVPWISPASGLTATSYTLNIFVWNGDKTSPPSEPEYAITKTNSTTPLQEGTDSTINISRLIVDFIDVTAVGGASSGVYGTTSAQWVKWNYTYVTSGGIEGTPQGDTTKLFSRGYSYGNEGANIETITNNRLFNGSEFKAYRESKYSLPIKVSETLGTSYSIISYPDNEIYIVGELVARTTSPDILKNVIIDLGETTTDEYVVLTANSVELATILIEEECKYTPLDIYFLNKFGNQQAFTFFKERKDTLSVTSSEFESDRGQPSDGNHQFVRYNVQARGEFSVFTGFIDESNNDTIQELLLSEKIWSYDGTDFTPLTIKTKSQQWKTQQNERLINYEINFENGYNTINNI